MPHYMSCSHLWHAVCMAWHVRIPAPACLPTRLGLKVGESGAAHRMAFERVIIAFHTYNIQASLCQDAWTSPGAAIASAKAGRALLLHTYTVPV
eukprot:2759677-Pyramimonas_sp.AAC.1